MSQTPQISVLIPTFNQVNYLPLAVESIQNQSFEDFELIIIDDHSTDETSECLHKLCMGDPRIHVIRNAKQAGVAHSLNQGLALAQGEYIARMDSDDISHQDRFKHQIDYLKAHQEVGVLGTQTIFMDEHGAVSHQLDWEKPTSHNVLIWQLIYTTPFCHPSIMMRTELLRDAGGYNPHYSNEDMELWTRLVFSTRLNNLQNHLLYYRMPYDRHLEKLAYWEPHVHRVSQQYVQRLLGHEVSFELIKIFHRFQHSKGYDIQELNFPVAIEISSLLEEIFRTMVDQHLFEPDSIEEVHMLLVNQIQALMSVAL